MPLECLLALEEVEQTAEGQQTVFELQQLMADAKELFAEQNICRNIVEVMEKELGKIQVKREKYFGVPETKPEKEGEVKKETGDKAAKEKTSLGPRTDSTSSSLDESAGAADEPADDRTDGGGGSRARSRVRCSDDGGVVL